MAVAAFDPSEGCRDDAAEHFAESHISGMQSADAVTFADMFDLDCRLHLANSNHVSESVLKAPKDIHREEQHRHCDNG
jgi:hypothetical protein